MISFLPGGEPLANLKSLQVMLDKVSSTHHIYINTTLPVNAHQTERGTAGVPGP